MHHHRTGTTTPHQQSLFQFTPATRTEPTATAKDARATTAHAASNLLSNALPPVNMLSHWHSLSGLPRHALAKKEPARLLPPTRWPTPGLLMALLDMMCSGGLAPTYNHPNKHATEPPTMSTSLWTPQGRYRRGLSSPGVGLLVATCLLRYLRVLSHATYIADVCRHRHTQMYIADVCSDAMMLARIQRCRVYGTRGPSITPCRPPRTRYPSVDCSGCQLSCCIGRNNAATKAAEKGLVGHT